MEKDKNIVTKDSSINDKVDYLGIKRIGDRKTGVFWEYNGIKIPRPSFKACWKAVKQNFGIDSDLLKEEGYYK
jgi:hypothetical protein